MKKKHITLLTVSILMSTILVGPLALAAEKDNSVQMVDNTSGLNEAAEATPNQEIIISDVVTPEIQSEVQKESSLSVDAKASLTPVYRVYNPNSGEHLHTLSENEKNSLMNSGWVYEGVSMQIDGSGSALYRTYNPNSGEHFYTKDSNEVSDLTSKGWKNEGTAWNTPDQGEKVYRVFNPNARNAGSHHYTLTESEKNDLVSKGWRDEGVSWMVSGGAINVKSTNVIASVPYVSQYVPVKAPWGCASASLAMLLGSKNIRPDLRTMQNNLPMYPSNPEGQQGNVYTGVGFGWVIKPNALAAYGRSFGGNVGVLNSEQTYQIINRVLNDQPVLYYGYSSYQKDAVRNHCKVIAGYKDGKFLVYDPLYYSADAGPMSGGGNAAYDRGARAWVPVGAFNAERMGQELTIE